MTATELILIVAIAVMLWFIVTLIASAMMKPKGGGIKPYNPPRGGKPRTDWRDKL